MRPVESLLAMAWNCSRCREEIDEDFEVCWACGTGRDGTIDPDFQNADEYEPFIPEENSQFAMPSFSLGSLFNFVTALCLVLGVLGGAFPGLSDDIPMILLVILTPVASVYLTLHLVVWLITSRMQKWQRKHRAIENKSIRR